MLKILNSLWAGDRARNVSWVVLIVLTIFTYFMRGGATGTGLLAITLMTSFLLLKNWLIIAIFMKSNAQPVAIRVLLHGWNFGVVGMIVAYTIL